MKRIIRLTESDLTRIVRRVIQEQETGFPSSLIGGGGSKSIGGGGSKSIGGGGSKSIGGGGSKSIGGGKDFSSVISSLKTFNIPKVINFQDNGELMTTLNWGKMSDRGKTKSWGYTIGSDGYQVFLSTNPREAKLFEMIMGKKTEKVTENYSYDGFMDPTTAVSKVKELINGLYNMA
jgi:hypothetical protein